MFDIVTIGGITQDIFLISPNYQVGNDTLKFTWGEKFVVDDLFLDVGGGACNSAVGFSRLGLSTALWCRMNKDNAGKFAEKRLKEEGVSLKFIDYHQDSPTSLSIVLVDETGERSIIMFRGQNDKLDKSRIDFEKIFDTRWLFVAELTGNPTPLIEQIVNEAVEKGVKFSFVPGLDQLEQGVKALKNILPKTEVLIFNDFEAGKLLDREEKTRYSEEEVKSMLKELCSYGTATAVITKDVDGVQAFDGERFYSCPAPVAESLADTTGAGDAFASGFISALVRGQSVEEALRLGTKNAGSVIQRFGAQTGLIKSVNGDG